MTHALAGHARGGWEWFSLGAALLLLALFATGSTIVAGEIRSWRDDSGKFEVRAEFVDCDGEKVRLAKEDGKEISVALSRLCGADRAYVKRFLDGRDRAGKPDRGAAEESDDDGDDPTAETAARKAGSEPVRLRDVPKKRPGSGKGALVFPAKPSVVAEPVGGFVNDPGPALAPIRTATGVDVGKAIHGEFLSRAVPLDATGQRYLISVIDRDFLRSPYPASRVYRIDAETGSVTNVQQTKELYAVLDHDIESGITLLGEHGLSLGINPAPLPTRLVLASGFAEQSPKLTLFRDSPLVDDKNAAEVIDARLLSPRHVLVSFAASAGVWELDTGRALLMLPANGTAIASGGSRYVAIPSGNRVVVIEPATRRTVVAVQTAWAISGMAFDPGGRRLAIIEPGWITIQDCEAGGDPIRFQSPGATGKVAWVGPDLLLTGSGALVDVERKAVLWNYKVPPSFSAAGSTVVCRGGDHLCFLVVPHPAAEARRTIWPTAPDPIQLRPGDGVKIASEISEGVQIDRAGLEKTLGELAQRFGFRVTVDATTTLVARLDRLAPRTVRLGLGLGLGRTSGPSGPATMETHPLVASLEFRTDAGVAWSDVVVNSTSPVVMLQPNETLEAGVRRMETPAIAPFAAVTLPTVVERAELVAGRGSSTPTASGWTDSPLDAGPSRHDAIVNSDRNLRATLAESERLRNELLSPLQNPAATVNQGDRNEFQKKLDEAVKEGMRRREAELQGGQPGATRQPVTREWAIAIAGVVIILAFTWAAATWSIFTKAGRQGWECAIPIHGQATLLDIAGLPAWLVVIYLLPQVTPPLLNIAGLAGTAAGTGIASLAGLLFLGLCALHSQGLARNFGKGLLFACGLFFLPFIFMPILAFGGARYRPR